MSQSPAQFAVRTLRALEVLAFTPTTAPRVAEALGVHPRTARRLLSQLQRDGWVTYNPRPPHVYAPTLRLVALAAHVGARAPLATLSAPAIEQLHADTGLDALLAIPSYDATVCVVRCCGTHAVQPPLGDVTPAHRTATGKVLMAHRDAWRRSILDSPSATADHDLPDPAALERELTRIRLDGYATDDGEHLEGIRQVAAPVAGPAGDVLAAIAVAIHDSQPLDEIAPQVQHAAQTASEALAGAAKRDPLHRGVVHRLLASYGLAPVNAYL